VSKRRVVLIRKKTRTEESLKKSGPRGELWQSKSLSCRKGGSERIPSNVRVVLGLVTVDGERGSSGSAMTKAERDNLTPQKIEFAFLLQSEEEFW